MQYVDIIIPLSLPQLYTYHIPLEYINSCKIGMRVVVQFGRKKLYSAIIHSIHKQKPKHYETKDIISIIDERPIISELHIKFWEWLSNYYMCTLGDVMKAAIPSGLKLESQTEIYLNDNYEQFFETSNVSDNYSSNEQIIIASLKDNKKQTISKINSLLGIKNSLNIVNNLIEKQIINVNEKLQESYKPKLEKYIELSEEIKTEKDMQLAFNKTDRAPKQTEILIIFSELSKLKFNIFEKKFQYKKIKKKDLLRKTNASSGILKTLIDKKILCETEKEVKRIKDTRNKKLTKKILSEAQVVAHNQVKEHFKDEKPVLLHGVTSSGKTEIYIQLIEEYIKQGKQVLYLLPEIALTTQIIERLKNIFGNEVGVYHSKFNDSERVEIWNRINTDLKDISKYKIILGVRSSIFLPFENLGLIIIDEEHETTYKQYNPAPRYHARDSAIVLAKLHKAKVLLGTATPAVETYYNVVMEKFKLVELNQRHQNIKLPEIIIADIKQARKKKQMKSLFHPILINNIKNALDNKEQIILFQNRRGFSPYVECKTCSWIPNCEYCDVSLTYHKNINELSCHYCGYRMSVPKLCLACGEGSMETRGFGTQKIEEEIKIFFPKAKVKRMDLDTTRGKTGYEKIIYKFENRVIDILIGTQMVSKGLDFDNVSIVGIMNADNMLNFPDFRAYERSYQLMAQVSGRAGRKNKQGKVIIQTSKPKHRIIQYVLRNAYKKMFENQVLERKSFKYPPYYRLIKVTIKHKKRFIVEEFSDILANKLRKTFGNRVLGPEYPIISRIQTWYIKDILLKIDKKISINQSKKIIINAGLELKNLKNYSNISIIFNADPF